MGREREPCFGGEEEEEDEKATVEARQLSDCRLVMAEHGK